MGRGPAACAATSLCRRFMGVIDSWDAGIAVGPETGRRCSSLISPGSGAAAVTVDGMATGFGAADTARDCVCHAPARSNPTALSVINRILGARKARRITQFFDQCV